MIPADKFTTRPPRRQQGLSLIELMVALVVGLLVVAAVTSLTLNANRTNGELNKVSRQVENGRFAMHLLQNELRHAGYFGRLYLPGDPPDSPPQPCSTDVNDLEEGVPLPVVAYSSADDLTCLADADHVDNTDILVVRRADTRIEPALGLFFDFTEEIPDWVCKDEIVADSDYEQVYIQTQPHQFRFAVGVNPNLSQFDEIEKEAFPSGASCRPPIHLYRTDIFYISPSTHAPNDCEDNPGQAQAIPTLMRLWLSPDVDGWCSQPLVEGIENLQYDFGIDHSGDGVPDEYLQDLEVEDDEWANAMAVRINLLARSPESSPGYTDPKTYRMSMNPALVVDPAEKDFRRRVFARTVRLSNPAGRREMQ